MKDFLKMLGKIALVSSLPLLILIIAWLLTLGQSFDLLQVVTSKDYLNVVYSLTALAFGYFLLDWIDKVI